MNRAVSNVHAGTSPQAQAVGLAALLADEESTELLQASAEVIAERFRERYEPQEIGSVLASLQKSFGGTLCLEDVIKCAQISAVKFFTCDETGKIPSGAEIAKRLHMDEQEVLRILLNPQLQKLADTMTTAHVGVRIGDVHLSLFSAAKNGGNAKHSELLLYRFDSRYRQEVEPEVQQPDFGAMSTEERVTWIKDKRKRLGEPIHEADTGEATAAAPSIC